VGDVASGTISQFMRSRRKVMGLFILLLFALAAVYLNLRAPAPSTVYVCCFGFGLFAGYWAVFVTNASEQFGTNLRATVTTTAPNFVRGSAVLMTLSYLALHPSMGRPMAALVVCAVVTVLALVALAAIPERFDADLDYVEPL
jgi:MFS transporter, putative metabolite:H+ symporter